MERVLIECDKFFVFQQFECGGTDLREVAADEEWRRHDAPESEVGAVFGVGHRAADLKHVHVVVMSVAAVCGEVEVLVYNVFYGAPAVCYVVGYAP